MPKKIIWRAMVASVKYKLRNLFANQVVNNPFIRILIMIAIIRAAKKLI
jgi:hypothetical protein